MPSLSLATPHGSSPNNQIACNSKSVTIQCSYSRYCDDDDLQKQRFVLSDLQSGMRNPGDLESKPSEKPSLAAMYVGRASHNFCSHMVDFSRCFCFTWTFNHPKNSRLMLLPTPYFRLELCNMMFQFQLWQWQ